MPAITTCIKYYSGLDNYYRKTKKGAHKNLELFEQNIIKYRENWKESVINDWIHKNIYKYH